MNFSDELIISNCSSIGISLGADITSVKGWIDDLKKVELDRLHVIHVVDKKKVLEKEEKELAEEEELDKFILNHLCGEIMEEVMDLRNDQVDRIAPKTKPKSKKNKRGRRIHIPNSSQ